MLSANLGQKSDSWKVTQAQGKPQAAPRNLSCAANLTPDSWCHPVVDLRMTQGVVIQLVARQIPG